MNDERAYHYMNLEQVKKPADIELEHIFIGSCTNARLNEFTTGCAICQGKKIAPNLTCSSLVPGSRPVKRKLLEVGA